MKEIARYNILAEDVRSLCWDGDDLVDWVDGGVRYYADGTRSRRQVFYAYRFDQAQILSGTTYAVIYERLGTKGLVLNNSKHVREINRSYYCAHSYDYPIALFKLLDGRPVIAHCPDEYCRLEIEDLETGERLTHRNNKPDDFFHSRLQISSDGRYLLSAGWFWHPLDLAQVFDLAQVLKDPTTFESGEWVASESGVELNNACFLGNDTLILTGGAVYDEPDENDASEALRLTTGDIGVYSLSEQRFLSVAHLEEPAGTLMPVGKSFVIGFYEHPKVIELATGKVIARWPDLDSGKQNSSICSEKLPPIALDPLHLRFAVADGEHITVVQLGE